MTRLLRECAAGRDRAFDELIELVYGDLQRIAHRSLKAERSGHTLDTHALVHETYLKLIPQATASWGDRAHFFALASRVIRHILIDYARRRGTVKRDGGLRIPLRENTAGGQPPDVALLDLESALDRLGKYDERLMRIVECRFFGGMTVPETAEALGVSTSTVDRGWARARTYLYRDLSSPPGSRSTSIPEDPSHTP